MRGLRRCHTREINPTRAPSQDRGVIFRSRTRCRTDIVAPRRRGPITPGVRDVSRRSNKVTNAAQNIGDTAYGSPPEPVIGPAIAGPVGGEDKDFFVHQR
jgi:hypothetical protein